VSATVIASERWIWRNLPPAPGFTGNAAETLRRVAGVPPADLMDGSARDASEAVSVFDEIGGIAAAWCCARIRRTRTRRRL
jgi:hypothetical protein